MIGHTVSVLTEQLAETPSMAHFTGDKCATFENLAKNKCESLTMYSTCAHIHQGSHGSSERNHLCFILYDIIIAHFIELIWIRSLAL